MKKILVTGGAGFIGSTLVNKLVEKYEVVVVDDLSMGTTANLLSSENITFIHGSVTDIVLMDDILKKNQFKFIFHLAAVASVAASVENPVYTHKVNFDSTLIILELVKKYQNNLKRIVFSSSAAVYGRNRDLPKTETSQIEPLTPYAVDKFASERYILNYYELYGLPTSAVRFFNVYGPKQNPNSPYSGVISILMDKFIQNSHGNVTPFIFYGDGKQTRDFIYVDDVVEALLLVANKNEALGNVYNVGTGTETSLLNLMNILSLTIGSNIPYEFRNKREGDIENSFADITKLLDIGYEPRYSLADGIKNYVDYETKEFNND